MRYVLGIDLGAEQDYTAGSLIEHRPHAVPDHMNPGSMMIEHHYHLRSIFRFPLGTGYTQITESIRNRMNHPDLRGNIQLAADRTGVGAAVMEMFTDAGLFPMPIYITGGQVPTSSRLGMNVPKLDLIACLSTLMQTNRLHAAPHMDYERELREELANFRAKKTRNGQDTASAWRSNDHDDLVLSLAISCYVSMKLNDGNDINLPKKLERKNNNVFSAVGI